MRERAAGILEAEQVNPEWPIIAVQPFSLWDYKEWGIEKFSALIRRILSNYNASVLITGSPNEHDKAQSIVERCKEFDRQVINLAGKTSLSELTAILECCALFIGMDSAGMHLAGAVGTPTAIIFGPSSPLLWAPRGPQHCVIQKDLPCLPCNQKGCNGSETSRCLKELEVDEVWAALKLQLEKNGIFKKK
jgi:heptosyltransferase-3